MTTSKATKGTLLPRMTLIILGPQKLGEFLRDPGNVAQPRNAACPKPDSNRTP